MLFPEKFKEILERDQKYLGIVNKTASDFSKILETNRLEFFPDYTDHGIKHVECVLKTAEQLIIDDSFEYLEPIDVTLIILSVIIHDIGMHITHPGFLKLINSEYDSCRIKDFDKNIWAKSWELFMQEAKKFNQKQLLDIFGDKNAVVNDPPEKNLTENDKKLIGEFIRRNHPRLAHEIAINGFPSAEGSNIEFAHGLNSDLKDLAGLIARSHGIPLRNTIDYLKNEYTYNWFNPYDSKIFFIMGLLRISDYIQINSDRANEIVLKTKILSSPKSKQEWEKNDSVKHVYYNAPDPELITVDARPQNSLTFLELSKLFKDIQNEFDLTWAVLGEVYGRNDGYKNLKYKFRRIKSNIDDIEKFSETIDYIPEKVIFDAEPELLKLLVGPLYGKNPTYGVRELLQNAVDACRERQFLIEKHYGLNSKEYQDYKPEIKISIKKKQDENYYFAIEDNGIGMTKDILINYFFKAGASFINSDVWKKDFVDENSSKVQRSGRFGVGILASFLLGDEIEVATKSIDSEEAYQLIASIDTEQVEILKSIFNVGTKISIKLSEDVMLLINKSDNYKKMNWFLWYRFINPKISYEIDKEIQGKFLFLNNSELIPDYTEKNKHWRISHPQYFNRVKWTITSKKSENYFNKLAYQNSGIESYGGNYGNNSLFCNGFCIPGNFSKIDLNWYRIGFSVSVFDFNSKLPLTLDRNFLDGNKLPFLNNILEDFGNDVIARLLTLKISRRNYHSLNTSLVIHYETPIDLTEELILKENGFFLYCDYLLKKMKIQSIIHIWFNQPHIEFLDIVPDNNYLAFLNNSDSIRSYTNKINGYSECGYYNYSFNRIFNLNESSFKRIILKKERFEYLFNSKKKRIPDYIKRNFVLEKQNRGDWVTLKPKFTYSLKMSEAEIDEKLKSNINYLNLKKYKNNISLIIEKYYSLNSNSFSNIFVRSIEHALYQYLSPDYIIPYDMEERKKKFPKAFKELARFIKNYE
jgi:molecular chaperone HtpG